jgi:ankyrin repeat protein
MAHLEELLAALSNPQTLSTLIPHASKNDLDQALSFAAVQGNLNAVRILMPKSNIKRRGMEALIWAADQGHHAVVAELLTACDANDEDERALRRAAQRGHLETVRTLIPFGDQTARTALALRLAALYGHRIVVNELADAHAEQVFRQQIAGLQQAEVEGSLELIDMLSQRVGIEERWHAVHTLLPAWSYRLPELEEWHDTERRRLIGLAETERTIELLNGVLPHGKEGGRRTSL